MIEEQARVLAVGNGLALVETSSRSACGSCSSSSGCGTSRVAELFGERANRLQVSDAIGLAVGDRVVIGIADGTLIRASLLAYLWPLVALALAAYIAQSTGASEGFSALVGILGLCVGLWITGRVTGGEAGRSRYRPVLLRRADLRRTAIPTTDYRAERDFDSKRGNGS
jgi:sigma-E factor negative regulatory protein RseC